MAEELLSGVADAHGGLMPARNLTLLPCGAGATKDEELGPDCIIGIGVNWPAPPTTGVIGCGRTLIEPGGGTYERLCAGEGT